MKHIAIGLALVFAVPLSGCGALLQGQSAVTQASAAQFSIQALTVAEIAYTQAVKNLTRLVQADILTGAALKNVLAIRDTARKVLDAGDGSKATAAVYALTIAVGAQMGTPTAVNALTYGTPAAGVVALKDS